MFLDEKTVLEICLNPGLNLTIFRGTGPRLFFFFAAPRPPMTRGTLEKLCREVAATGSTPQGNHLERAPIPVHC